MKHFDSKRGGFTLIELLVTISIISFMSSVVIANVNSAREKARVTSLSMLQTSYKHLFVDRIVGEFSFEDNTNDSGRYVANWSFGNNGGSYTQGVSGKAIDLSGGTNAYLSSWVDNTIINSSAKFDEEGTVEFFFLQKESLPVNGRSLLFMWTGNSPRIYTRNTVALGDYMDTQFHYYLNPTETWGDSSPAKFTINKWHYVVYSWNKNYWWFYFDGQLIQKYAHSGSLPYLPYIRPTGSTLVGSYNPTYFNGYIDNLNIYNVSFFAE
jgi:prepilin-type N-terminal cleavage/methylation domain-containing protein